MYTSQGCVFRIGTCTIAQVPYLHISTTPYYYSFDFRSLKYGTKVETELWQCLVLAGISRIGDP